MRHFYEAIVIAVFYLSLVAASHYLGGIPLSPGSPFMALKVYKLAMPEPLLFSFLIAAVLAGFALLLNPYKTVKIHGESHLATEKEIKEMGLRAEDGLILGKKRGQFLRVDKPLSVLVFAPPGTGKTAAEIIPSLLASPSSTITFDVKGELLAKTGPWRSQFSKVFKFAPGEHESARWNPLSKEELPEAWEDKEVHLGRIAECLFPAPKDDEGSHWVIEARRIFIFWGLYLILQGGDEGETSFREIMQAALSRDPQGTIVECLLDEGLPERIVMEGNTLVGKANREFSGVLSSFAKGMNIFMDPRVARNTSGSDIRLTDLRHERSSIYLVVSNQDSTRLKPILTLFFELAANTALAKEPKKDKNDKLLAVDPETGKPQLPITLFMDEFVRLGKMDEVKRIPAIGRSYYLNCVFVVQTLAQLQDVYGQSGADEIIGTCSYQVFFTQNDANAKFTAQLSKAIGNKTVKTRSRSGKFMEAKSSSEGETGIPLFRVEDINSLPFGEVIILAQNHFKRPILAKAAFWFKDSNLKKYTKFVAADFNPVPQAMPLDEAPAEMDSIEETELEAIEDVPTDEYEEEAMGENA